MFISYAQNFEDVMLRRALRRIEFGFYIDAGASFPIVDSVTKAFYQQRWRGINIEPGVAPYAALLADRPEDINLNVALGDTETAATFFVIGEDSGLSTLSADFAETHQEAGWSARRTIVEMTTLATICERHAAPVIHFLKIDVEGAEASLLRGADFTRFRPWIILIEATQPNTQIPTYHEWEPLLASANYQFVYFDGLNRFYLAAEQYEALAPAFATPPNVFDQFVRYREIELARELEAAKNTGGGSQVEASSLRAKTRQKPAIPAHAILRSRPGRGSV